MDSGRNTDNSGQGLGAMRNIKADEPLEVPA